jgi:hypothetical protein
VGVSRDSPLSYPPRDIIPIPIRAKGYDVPPYPEVLAVPTAHVRAEGPWGEGREEFLNHRPGLEVFSGREYGSCLGYGRGTSPDPPCTGSR